MSVFLFATLDTKGHEAGYLRDVLRGLDVEVTLVDAGCLAPPLIEADVSRETLFAEGGHELAQLLRSGDRGSAVTAAADCATRFISRFYAAGEVDGVLALGGSAGTTIGTAAMRALPLGVPKIMISTLASGQVRQFVGDKDIMMLNSVVDIAGLNRITRAVLGAAARAMAGLIRSKLPTTEKGVRYVLPERPGGCFAQNVPDTFFLKDDKPLIAATMFGVTTPCVEHARRVLEEAGYEVLVFHATGSGGQAMESLIAEGQFVGVLDLTTTELADELVGGFLSAGPERLTAAARHGVPQVVSVGATDMVNFYGPDSVPARFSERQFHRHNANVTLMRTTPDENAAIGADIGRKLSSAAGPAAIVLPLRGVSALDCAGQPFDDPQARAALYDAIRSTASGAEIIELDQHINDRAFAEAAARQLLAMLRAGEE